MNEELLGIIEQMEAAGESPDAISEMVQLYESQNVGKTPEPETVDAPAVPDENTASDSEELSSELPTQEEEPVKTPKQIEEERAAKEIGYRQAHASIPGAAAAVASLPDFLLEPYAAFESTVLGFVGGVADFATQQYARFDQTRYSENPVNGE